MYELPERFRGNIELKPSPYASGYTNVLADGRYSLGVFPDGDARIEDVAKAYMLGLFVGQREGNK